MPTTDPVIVPIQGKDTLTPAVQKATMSLRDLGQKGSMIGMRISALFTVPIVLAGKGLLAFGQNSSKTLSDLNKAIGDANASHDPAKIKAAWKEWNNLSPSVREAGIAYDRLQQTMQPVNAEMDKTKTILLTALVPILKELAPTIISVAKGAADMAQKFSLLPQWQQNIIISSVALLAALGPLTVGFFQMLQTVGTLQLMLPGLSGGIGTVTTALKGLGTGAYAALGPVGALILAVTTLIGLINGGQDAQAWNTLQKLVGIGLLQTGVISNQQFLTGAQNAGLTAAPAGGGGGMNITINNNSPITTAQNDEAARQIAKLMPSINRQMGRQ
jgi:hypothetical protein